MRKKRTIDFAPLAGLLARSPVFSTTYLSILAIAMAVLVITPIFFIGFFKLSYGIYIVYLLLLLIVGSIVYQVILTKKKRELDRKIQENNNRVFSVFAKTNGFKYKPEAFLTEEREPGSLYHYGQDSKRYKPGKMAIYSEAKTFDMRESSILTGDLHGYPAKVCDILYSQYYGKVTYNFDIRVARLKLPQKLPHIVIDCLLESGVPGVADDGSSAASPHGSVLPIEYDESQRVQLEGDFSDYYAVYTPDDLEVSALTILTPDVMQRLLDLNAKCDIEIVDRYVYFYWFDNAITKQSYEELFGFVEAVMDEIGNTLSRADFSTNNSGKVVSTTATEAPVLTKKRFTVRTVAISVLLCLMLLLLLKYILTTTLNGINSTESIVLIMTLPFALPLLGYVMAIAIDSRMRDRLIKKLRKKK